MSNTKDWKFSHDDATTAEWTPGLREIFEYRDLGIKDGTKGDYVAHLVRHNGKEMKDDVQHWHVHDCTFQMVYVMNGWATFEYAGHGQRTGAPARKTREPAASTKLLQAQYDRASVQCMYAKGNVVPGVVAPGASVVPTPLGTPQR